MPRHRGKGRRKAEMKSIEKPEARQVCFSKRRQGLFKKASELSVLCGAHVGALAFSPAGRAYSFGSPSVDAVVDHYLSGTAGPLPTPHTPAVQEPGGPRADEELKLPRLWDADIEELGLEDLREYEEALVELQGEIKTRTLQALSSNTTVTEGQPSSGEADDVVAMDKQPAPAEATSHTHAATDDLPSSAKAADPGQEADGGSANDKYEWLSLLPPPQQLPAFC